MWGFIGGVAIWLTARAGAHIVLVAGPFVALGFATWAVGAANYGATPGPAYTVFVFAVIPALALHAWMSVISGHGHRWISPIAAIRAWRGAAKASRGRAVATAWTLPLTALAAAVLVHPQWASYAATLTLAAGIASALGGLVAGAWLTASEREQARDAGGLERVFEVALGVTSNPTNPLEIWREGEAVVARVPAGAVAKLAGAEARVAEHFPAWEVASYDADFLRLAPVSSATQQRRAAVAASGGLAAEMPAPTVAPTHVPSPVYAAAPGEPPTMPTSGPLDFTDA